MHEWAGVSYGVIAAALVIWVVWLVLRWGGPKMNEWVEVANNLIGAVIIIAVAWLIFRS